MVDYCAGDEKVVAMVVVAVLGYCGLVVVVVVMVFGRVAFVIVLEGLYLRVCCVANVLAVGVLYLSVYLLLGNDICISIGGDRGDGGGCFWILLVMVALWWW